MTYLVSAPLGTRRYSLRIEAGNPREALALFVAMVRNWHGVKPCNTYKGERA
jgi:hypothetical protein